MDLIKKIIKKISLEEIKFDFKTLKKIALIFADTRIFFFANLWLMFLLVAGTVSQRSLGLYQAQEKYFSSFILWIGFIPTPGGYITMSVVFIGLLALLLFNSNDWKRKLGIIITHFGALLLLFGGFLTSVFSYEGSMSIAEGATSSLVQDYHKRELAIINVQKNKDKVISFASGWLEKNKKLNHNNLAFTITILEAYKNSQFIANKKSSSVNKEYKGLAKDYHLQEVPAQADDGLNRQGIKIKISKAGADNGIYILAEHMKEPLRIFVNSKQYAIVLRFAKKPLPFQIELIDFQEKKHPGTAMAKSYSSEVIVKDKDLKQRAIISMNKPLRYKGYTFYQSSFSKSETGETTVLSVVQNKGKYFPYISSLIMCIGLLIHLLIQAPLLFRKKEIQGEI